MVNTRSSGLGNLRITDYTNQIFFRRVRRFSDLTSATFSSRRQQAANINGRNMLVSPGMSELLMKNHYIIPMSPVVLQNMKNENINAFYANQYVRCSNIAGSLKKTLALQRQTMREMMFATVLIWWKCIRYLYEFSVQSNHLIKFRIKSTLSTFLTLRVFQPCTLFEAVDKYN